MLTNDNFKKVFEEEEFTLALISGNGCANCSTMASVVHKMDTVFSNLTTHLIDVNEHNYLINKYYEVEVVPTTLFLYHGRLVSKVQGYQPEEILEIYIECKMKEVLGEKD